MGRPKLGKVAETLNVSTAGTRSMPILNVTPKQAKVLEAVIEANPFEESSRRWVVFGRVVECREVLRGIGAMSMSKQRGSKRQKAASRWPHTGISGSVKNEKECLTLVHVADLDKALAIVKRGAIQPYPERELGNALHCKPVEVVWLSPLDYDDSVFGCVAFHFEWTALQEEYGDYIYGLQEVEGRAKGGISNWKSRILFSHTEHDDDSWVRYDPAAVDEIPWKVNGGRNYIRSGCDCQIGIAAAVSLRHLHSIRFVNQKEMGGRGGSSIFPGFWADQLFLCRVVADGLPCIQGWCDVDSSTKKVPRVLLNAWGRLWSEIWRQERYECEGKVKVGDEMAETLARAFLDRYAKAHHGMKPHKFIKDDAKKIASLFRSTRDLILSLRRVVAVWAGVKNESSLDGEDWDWPPEK